MLNINSHEMEFEIVIDDFESMSKDDQELLLSSLSEKEKLECLGMFKTLPGNKVGWFDNIKK